MLPARRMLFSLALLSCALASCEEPEPAELARRADEALRAGDYRGALRRYERAFARLDASAPEYLDARLGAIEAMIPIDAKRAKDEFLRLADEQPAAIEAKHYCNVGGRLADAGAWEPAIEVIDAGLKRFEMNEPKLEQLFRAFKKGLQESQPRVWTIALPGFQCEFWQRESLEWLEQRRASRRAGASE